ncbi:MAG: nucleotide exchange factor GrpE [Gammaproteobacteria bacterium]|nr:MAG: nucleotide exchange factor GrpE [Gammaproteobacteria bacterium]
MAKKNKKQDEKEAIDQDTIKKQQQGEPSPDGIIDSNEAVVDIEQSGAVDENTSLINKLRSDLVAAEEKIEEHKNRFLLAKAEMDNVRKRAERDVANAHKYALDKFVPELLTVKDSLELGAKAAKESVAETPNEQVSKFIEGSEMTINIFADTLKKFGVEVVDPQGELFNPEFHQAMTMVPNDDLPVNTVIEVVQKGYTLNGRLLRPAMVIVSKKTL